MMRRLTFAIAVLTALTGLLFLLPRGDQPEVVINGPVSDRPEPPMEPVPPALPASGPYGAIVVDGGTLAELGRVPLGTARRQTFPIKNSGRGPLTIARGPASCGCTVAQLGDRADAQEVQLAPGQATGVTITFQANKPGAFRNQATLLTNDPDRRQVPLQVQGEVFAAFVTDPRSGALEFPRIDEDETSVSAMAITSPGRPKFRILGVLSSNPEAIVVTFRPGTYDLPTADGYVVQVTLPKSGKLGAFREEVVVRTDHPEQPELKIPVSGTRAAAVSANPAVLRLSPRPDGGHQGLCVISVKNPGPTSFEVVEAPEGLSVRIEPNASSVPYWSYRLIASLPPGARPTPQGAIVLKTDHPRVPTLRIPLP